MKILMVAMLMLGAAARIGAANALVIQTDFGTKDGAVAAMKGIAFGVSSALPIFDLSQENTPYDIWEAAYRLKQTAAFWPAGTVFVSVVDPGVGTDRAAVVVRTKSGHFFVGPDNGTWTFVAEQLGVDGVRRIDDARNRRPGSEKSHTFHGRDIFAYVGARLAAGVIPFEEVGPALAAEVVRLPYQAAARDGDALVGTIPQIDFQYGNVWTNIPDALFQALTPAPRIGDVFRVVISHAGKEVWRGEVPYARTFGDVREGEPLLYLNSLLDVALALNQGSFSAKHQISSGGDWTVRLERAK